ncbi:MAG: RNB domain-containing ribonuclease, partial [Bdellovibrionaceae bacterium]|nr:RNB domain-containing ribonuclease [Pseudobdellovibrionaceae bacterium]
STTNVGHFGLGFEFYTHFTSPIRRYPDLIVHRLLKSQILKNKNYKLMNEEDLDTFASWLSACEQKAAKCERQIQSIKKARFMEKFLGDEFEGMINSVTRFGVFVLLREYDIDGLVKIDDLSTQRLEFDETTLSLYNKRTGLRFTIGDTIKIKVISADHELGQINFMPVEVVERKQKQSDQYLKEEFKKSDFKKSKENSNKDNFSHQKNKSSSVHFKKSKKTLAERLFKKKKNQQTHFSSKSNPDNKRGEMKYRGSISEKFSGNPEKNDFFNPQNKNNSDVNTPPENNKSNTPAWKPVGVDYSVNTSKRASILDKLDQAIASRNRNHSFSGGGNKTDSQTKETSTGDENHNSRSQIKNKKQKETGFGSGFKTESTRKNSKKRGKVKNHRRGVR